MLTGLRRQHLLVDAANDANLLLRLEFGLDLLGVGVEGVLVTDKLTPRLKRVGNKENKRSAWLEIQIQNAIKLAFGTFAVSDPGHSGVRIGPCASAHLFVDTAHSINVLLRLEFGLDLFGVGVEGGLLAGKLAAGLLVDPFVG